MSEILTEDYGCAAIMGDRERKSFVLPRYTPTNWWECDVFELTASGYFREYEIKLTLADFKNDAKKRRERRPWTYGTPPTWEMKHEFLAKGDAQGPAEFSFVAPVGLILPETLPIWAGLIELHDRGEGHRPSYRWRPATVVKAPRLHNEKAHPKIRPAALGACYYRFHDALKSLRDSTRPRLEWNDEPPPAIEEPTA